MLDETFVVPESVAGLSIDVSEFSDGDSLFSRTELLTRIDDLIEQLLDDPTMEMPVSMLKALEIGWKSQLEEG
ncbi:MAG: hypothetical protein KDB27_31165 [Planctomycetales bacterium]|nr:hypothetical protein [Planctomycetales bacterium]